MAQFGLNVRIRSAPICTGRWLLKKADRNDVIKNGLNIEPLPHSFNIFTNATQTLPDPNAVGVGHRADVRLPDRSKAGAKYVQVFSADDSGMPSGGAWHNV